MDIRILGTGCAKCQRLEALAREAVEEAGVEATISKVKDMKAIMEYDIAATPGLVIDGEVKCGGRLPRKEEIVVWIRSAQEA